MGMDCGDIDPETKARLLEELKHLPEFMCFVRCEYCSRSESTFRCWLSLNGRRLHFFVHFSVLKDEHGGLVSPGQVAHYGSKGWLRGEVASPDRDGLMLIRLKLNQGDMIEVEVEPGCVLAR